MIARAEQGGLWLGVLEQRKNEHLSEETIEEADELATRRCARPVVSPR